MERLRCEIERLEPRNHDEILRILLEHKVPYTRNHSGVFFNTDDLTSEALMAIERHLAFLEKLEASLVCADPRGKIETDST